MALKSPGLFIISDDLTLLVAETLPVVVQRIVDELHPDKIILIGSFASSTLTPDSDVDLLKGAISEQHLVSYSAMFHNHVISFLAFLLRHLIASIVSVVTPILLVILAYFSLLIVAIVGNFGLGGPLALPFWAIATGIVSLLYTVFLLFPTVLIAEQISKKFPRQYLAQIIIASTTLAVLVMILTSGIRLLPNYSNNMILHWANFPLPTFLVLCLPLGLYYWTTRLVQAAVTRMIAFAIHILKQ